ncbi:MAG: HAD family hydrolase [Clostridia bacterium]|nr:HAD family hydrolase [Clostridia bacterium]
MKTVLFDLDGTLLPMDQDAFIATFLECVHRDLVRLGYPPELSEAALAAAFPAVLANDGKCTNETVFLGEFEKLVGARVREDARALARYYQSGFSEVRRTCGHEPRAALLLSELHAAGVPAVLATSPLFPREATGARIGWAGLTPEDFTYITTYENSSFCKPHLGYYRELLDRLSLDPRECLMVGNDATEDMVAGELGMEVFLLTDHLVNRHGLDIAALPHGDFGEMMAAVRAFCL